MAIHQDYRIKPTFSDDCEPISVWQDSDEGGNEFIYLSQNGVELTVTEEMATDLITVLTEYTSNK